MRKRERRGNDNAVPNEGLFDAQTNVQGEGKGREEGRDQSRARPRRLARSNRRERALGEVTAKRASAREKKAHAITREKQKTGKREREKKIDKQTKKASAGAAAREPRKPQGSLAARLRKMKKARGEREVSNSGGWRGRRQADGDCAVVE